MSHSDNGWKEKYLQSLADIEKKEQQWQLDDSSLRKCISRLSFIGDGRDPDLDRDLETLRNRVRGEKDVRHLLSIIEDIGAQSEQIPTASSVREQLQQISNELVSSLQAFTFPDGFSKQVRSTIRQLKKEEMSLELLQSVLQLLGDALNRPESATAEGGGILSRLFNRSTPVAETRETQQEAVSQASAQARVDEEGLQSKGDLHQLAREILSLLVRKLDQVDGWERPLMPMLGRIDQAPTGNALINLTEELAGMLVPTRQVVVPADQALLQLLDMLNLTHIGGHRLSSLRQRLSRGLEESDLPDVLEQIVDLVAQLRKQAEEERHEVENFLLQLTRRLQDLDSELTGVDQVGSEIVESNREFGESVRSHMTDLSADVAAATDLGELKLSISDRIAMIEERLKQHRVEEEIREKRLKSDIGGLKQRLREVEAESGVLKNTVREARQKAFKDALTGLNNRMAFDNHMDEEYARWSRYQHPMCLIVIDIDDFKTINDTYGHKAGDKVLRVVGAHLNQQVRKADFAARYGGEEFVVLMPETGLADACMVAEKIRHAIASKGFHSRDHAVRVTVSAGVAEFHAGETADQAFNRADAALYRAKQTGKDRCVSESELE